MPSASVAAVKLANWVKMPGFSRRRIMAAGELDLPALDVVANIGAQQAVGNRHAVNACRGRSAPRIRDLQHACLCCESARKMRTTAVRWRCAG